MEIRTHDKRDPSLPLGDILGIVIGSVVAINLVVLAFWLVIRRRDKKLDKEYQRHSTASSTDLECKYLKKITLSPHSHPEMPRLQYIKARPFVPPPTASTVHSAHRNSRPHTLPSHHPLHSTNAKAKAGKTPSPSTEPSPGHKHNKPQHRLRRANSFDTTSIYSSASAPREQHDRALHTQPFAINPTTHAPVWAPRLFQPPPVMVLKNPAGRDNRQSQMVHQFRSGNAGGTPTASPLSLHIRSLDDLPFDSISLLSVAFNKEELPSPHPFQLPAKNVAALTKETHTPPLRIRARTMSAPYPERPPSMLSPSMLPATALPPAMPVRSPLRDIERGQ